MWGVLAVEAIKEEKMIPIPAPAPIKPEQANPAPMYLVASKVLKPMFWLMSEIPKVHCVMRSNLLSEEKT